MFLYRMQIVDALGEDGLLRYYGLHFLPDNDHQCLNLLGADYEQVCLTEQRWAPLWPRCFPIASTNSC